MYKQITEANAYALAQAMADQTAFEWFRKEHGIRIFFDYFYYDGMNYGFKWVKKNGSYGEDWRDNGDECAGWYTYEEAESACIDKLIELVKQK